MDFNTVLAVADVLRAAQQNAAFMRLQEDGSVLRGTARRISGDTEDNVLSCSLDVTTEQGWEFSWNIGVLAQEVLRGEFVAGRE